MDGYRRFKWGYGKLLKKLGEAHNLELVNVWRLKPGDDWIDNTVRSPDGAIKWRGKRDSEIHRRGPTIGPTTMSIIWGQNDNGDVAYDSRSSHC